MRFSRATSAFVPDPSELGAMQAISVSILRAGGLMRVLHVTSVTNKTLS